MYLIPKSIKTGKLVDFFKGFGHDVVLLNAESDEESVRIIDFYIGRNDKITIFIEHVDDAEPINGETMTIYEFVSLLSEAMDRDNIDGPMFEVKYQDGTTKIIRNMGYDLDNGIYRSNDTIKKIDIEKGDDMDGIYLAKIIITT